MLYDCWCFFFLFTLFTTLQSAIASLCLAHFFLLKYSFRSFFSVQNCCQWLVMSEIESNSLFCTLYIAIPRHCKYIEIQQKWNLFRSNRIQFNIRFERDPAVSCCISTNDHSIVLGSHSITIKISWKSSINLFDLIFGVILIIRPIFF